MLLVGFGQAPGVEAPSVHVHQVGTVAVVGVEVDTLPGARAIVEHDAAQLGVGAAAPVDVGERAQRLDAAVGFDAAITVGAGVVLRRGARERDRELGAEEREREEPPGHVRPRT